LPSNCPLHTIHLGLMRTVLVQRVIGSSCLLFVCLAAAVSGEEIKLEYVQGAEKGEAHLPTGSRGVLLSLEKPAGLGTVPAARSKQPVYGSVDLADGQRFIMLDKAKPEDELFTLVYFDANKNGDLTDDPSQSGAAVMSERRGRRSGYVRFPAEKTTILAGENALPFHYRISVTGLTINEIDVNALTAADLSENISCSFDVACYYAGELTLDGHTYIVALADRNANGRFGDRNRGRSTESGNSLAWSNSFGDALYITESSEATEYDAMVLGDYIVLRDRIFGVTVDEAGQRLVLDPVTADLSALELGDDSRLVMLQRRADGATVSLFSPGRKVMVPQGAYRLIRYQLQKRDAEGDLWQLTAVSAGRVEYVATGTAGSRVRFGQPFRTIVTISPSAIKLWQDGEGLKLSLLVAGSGDDRLVDVARLSGTKSKIEMSELEPEHPKEPAYHVLQPDGEIVAQGDFEYG
jgi:hypothetical protein